MKQIPENIYAENFVAKNNCLYDVRTNRQGSNERKLCNFVPWLVREVTMDDGVGEPLRLRGGEGCVVRSDDGQHRVCLVCGNAAARLPHIFRAEARTHFGAKSTVRGTPCGRGYSECRSLAPQFQTKPAPLGFRLGQENDFILEEQS